MSAPPSVREKHFKFDCMLRINAFIGDVMFTGNAKFIGNAIFIGNAMFIGNATIIGTKYLGYRGQHSKHQF